MKLEHGIKLIFFYLIFLYLIFLYLIFLYNNYMDYYTKYQKYKSKYIQLLNEINDNTNYNQDGGGMIGLKYDESKIMKQYDSLLLNNLIEINKNISLQYSSKHLITKKKDTNIKLIDRKMSRI